MKVEKEELKKMYKKKLKNQMSGIKNNENSDEKFYKDQIVELIGREGQWNTEELAKHDRILYATFGFHDGEPPHRIIARKLEELKNNKEFTLWGANINNFEKIKTFCKEIAKSGENENNESGDDVYLILLFTGNLYEVKCGKIDKRIEKTDKDVLEKELKGRKRIPYLDKDGICKMIGCQNCFDPWNEQQKQKLDKQNVFRYCDKDDASDPVDLIEQGILVKGNTQTQDEAFYVVDFKLIENVDTFFCAGSEKPCYYRLHEGTSGFHTQTIMLDRIKGRDIKEFSGNRWGIVLKLGYPYIVKCHN